MQLLDLYSIIHNRFSHLILLNIFLNIFQDLEFQAFFYHKPIFVMYKSLIYITSNQPEIFYKHITSLLLYCLYNYSDIKKFISSSCTFEFYVIYTFVYRLPVCSIKTYHPHFYIYIYCKGAEKVLGQTKNLFKNLMFGKIARSKLGSELFRTVCVCVCKK